MRAKDQVSKKKEKKVLSKKQMFAKYISDKELILGFSLTQTTLTWTP